MIISIEYPFVERRKLMSRIFRCILWKNVDMSEFSSALALFMFGLFAPLNAENIVKWNLVSDSLYSSVSVLWMSPFLLILSGLHLYILISDTNDSHLLRRSFSFVSFLLWSGLAYSFINMHWWSSTPMALAMAISIGLAYIKMGQPVRKKRNARST